MRVQQAHRVGSETPDELPVVYDFWMHSNSNKDLKRRHLRRSRATISQRLAAVTAQPVVGFGGDPDLMFASSPPSGKHGSEGLELYWAQRRRRPRYDTRRWLAVHQERCLACADRYHPQHGACQFDSLRRALDCGWYIPLAYPVPRFSQDNYPSAYAAPEAVDAFISKLLSASAMHELLPHEPEPRVYSPLSCVYKPEDIDQVKPRVALDASISGVNAAQPPWRFSYAGVEDLTSAVRCGWFMGKLDLKGYYNQLPVHPASQTLGGIKWRKKKYVYTSVAFGVALACGFASWVSAELAAMLRARGIEAVIVYLDDFLIAGPTREACAAAMKLALELFEFLGVVVAPGKTEGPAQELEFLGLVYDTVRRILFIVPAKLERLRAALHAAASAPSPPTGAELASFAGRLNWYSQVRPRLRWWAQPLWLAAGRTQYTATPQERSRVVVRRALYAAAEALATTVPAQVFAWDPVGELASFVRCDASGPDAAGGHWGIHAFSIASPPWWKSCENMVAKELFPLRRAVQLWGSQWRGKVVVFGLDNEGAVLAYNAGRSSNARTHAVLGEVLSAVEAAGAFVYCIHIPRLTNRLADALTHLCRDWAGIATWSVAHGLRLFANGRD